MILVASLKYRTAKRSKTKLLHEHVTTEIWCPTAVSCVDSLICNKEWAVCLHPSAYFYWVCGNSVSLGFLLKWSSGYKCYWGRLTCLCTQHDCINLIPLGNKTKTSLFFFPAFLTISIVWCSSIAVLFQDLFGCRTLCLECFWVLMFDRMCKVLNTMALASSNYFISYVKSVFVFRTKNAVSEDEQSEPESFGAFSQQGAKCTAEGEVSGCETCIYMYLVARFSFSLCNTK